ncbi:MAG: DUF2868 domain-containing protein [Polyangiales bacterium]
MKLRDVLDLEVQLAVDEGQDERALRGRDRGLYLTLARVPAQADGLLVAWLDALRERFGAPSAGAKFDAAQRVLGYLLAAFGLASGWGTAELLLHFEQGGAPVNIGHFLLVLVLGQLATLMLLAVSLTLRRLFARLPVVGDVGRFLGVLHRKLQALTESAPSDAASEAQRAALRRVRSRLGLYQDLERYALLGHSQLFALCFNLGALASCARLILLSDLAFAWSTSVASFDALQVQKLCAALSWPFGWLVPDAVPSATLIENTQYYRFEGRFAGAAAGTRGDAALAGEWWRFLIACTVTYGLLPRAFTLGWFRHRLRRAERRVPLDTPQVQRVLARMTTPELSTQATALAVQGAEASHAVARAPVSAALGEAAVLITYRDVPTAPDLLTREVARNLGIEATRVLAAGGFDPSAERAVGEALGPHGGAAAVVVEAWEAPDKGLRTFLAHLRAAMGPRRILRVILIGEARADGYEAPSDEHVRLFRDRLTLLDDPYLSVETLPAAGDAALRSEEAST